MSSSFSTPEARHARLRELAADWNVQEPAPQTPPVVAKPAPPTPADDAQADDLLRRRRLDAGGPPDRTSSLSLRKAFGGGGGGGGTSKKPWDPKEIFDALETLVAAGGNPGIADALITKLVAEGAPTRPGLLSRRKSTELSLATLTQQREHRSRVLLKAISNRDADMVAVLLLHADPPTVDAALPSALALGNRDILSALLAHGGSISRTREGEDAFLQACTVGGKADLVGLVLSSSEGRPTSALQSAAMVCAAQKGCLATVQRLSRAAADGDHNDAEALRAAISQGRVDVALAVVMGLKPPAPGGRGLSESFTQLTKHPSIGPRERLALAEAVLLAGASGDAVSSELVNSCKTEYYDMIELLLAYGASIEFQDAEALRQAISRTRMNVVRLLLAQQKTSLSSKHATQCLEAMPKAIPPRDRLSILTGLLRRGARGTPVHDALIDAADVGDLDSVRLLLSPAFLGNGGIPTAANTNGTGQDRHEVASVDHKGGLALSIAIKHGNAILVGLLMAANPSLLTLEQLFPEIVTFPQPEERFRMAQALVGGGLSQQCVSKALAQVLASPPVDLRLLELLLGNGAHVNVDHGLPLIHAAQNPDPKILQLVLQGGSPNAAALHSGLEMLAALPTDAEKVDKFTFILQHTTRKHRLSPILVSEVRTVLSAPPASRNFSIVAALIQAGADVNFQNAIAVVQAVRAADAALVDLMFRAKLAPASLAIAMPHSVNIVDAMDRLSFTQRLIDAGAPPVEANRALVYVINTHPGDLPLIKLLASHADSGDGEALMLAVKQEKAAVVETLLQAKASSKASGLRTGAAYYPVPIVQAAFQEAMVRRDSTHKEKRLRMCTALLKEGVLSSDLVSNALRDAAAEGDLALATRLIEFGANMDHEGAQEAVVDACGAGAADVLTVLLAEGGKSETAAISQQRLTKAFQAATQIGDLQKRGEVFRLLLEKGGISQESIDAQLVSAAKFGSEGEDLVRLLLQNSANVNYNNGEAVWNATRSAMLGTLNLLLFGSPNWRAVTPSATTLLRALKASRKLGREPRYQVIEWLFEVGLPSTAEDINLVLQREAKDEQGDIRLVRLLLKHGASPLHNGCEALIDAAQALRPDVLAALLEVDVPQKDISWAFQQAFTPDTASKWLSEPGHRVAQILLDKGAKGQNLSTALIAAVDAYGSDRDAVARQLVALFLDAKADVNYQDGLVVQEAAKLGDAELVRQLLDRQPNSRSVSLAFPYVFNDLPEDDTLRLVSLFTEYANGEERLDVMFAHPECEPVLVRSMSRFPRSSRLLSALLNAGYYHDQVTSIHVMLGIDELEAVTPLLWALLQPQKRVSTALLELLILRGAKVNYETPLSKTRPLIVAVQARRSDVVKALIAAGAEVDFADVTGNTPLTVATRVGGDLGTVMMADILEVDASRNDGSLHDAARELNLAAVNVLAEFGHDVDFPSPLHGGRSALAEVCLNAAARGPLTSELQKQFEKVIAALLARGADMSIQSDGCSVLLLALNSADPLKITRSLLKAGAWKSINAPFNMYNDGNFTFSPTQYVARVLPLGRSSPARPRPQSIQPQRKQTKPPHLPPRADTPAQQELRDSLLAVLRANRATDTYYANAGGLQPPDAANVPDDLLSQDREQRSRLARLEAEKEDHTLLLARMRSAADQAAVAEAARAAARLRHEEAAQAAKQAHERALTQVTVERAARVAEAELAAEQARRARALEWEREAAAQRLAAEQQMAVVRGREREEMRRLEGAREAAAAARTVEQRRLVDAQTALASRFHGGPAAPPRPVGYITGELLD